MDDMVSNGFFSDQYWVTVPARVEDFTPALPFIQDFEKPPITALTRSVSIGEYANYLNFSEAVIEESVKQVAEDMAFKMGQSLAAMVEATGGSDGTFKGNGLASIAASQTTQPSPA